MRLLLIEDDENISDMIKVYLENEGYQVVQAYDGLEAVNTYKKQIFDLVLLDLMIPKLSGMAVMKKIREWEVTPIVIVSAKDSDTDKAIGLGLGADDYVTKPFSLVELSARIKANIRRAQKYVTVEQKKQEIIQVGSLSINTETYEVKREDKVISLTSKEFELLKVLASNLGTVYTKAQLYKLVWKEEFYGDDNVINVHIRRLREKIEENPSNPQYIKTLWGIGYKMEAEL